MRKVMQILYSGLGGHASVVFSLVEGDVSKSTEHTAIFFGDLPLVNFYAERCESLSVNYSSILKARGPGLIARRRLLQLLESEQPDVVIAHIPSLISTVSKYKKAHPNTHLLCVEHHPNVLKTKRDWMYSKQLMQYADAVIFLTDIYVEQVKEKIGNYFNPSKSHTIHNGVNIDTFKSGITRNNKDATHRLSTLLGMSLLDQADKKTLTGDIKIAGMCTRLSDQKDIATLIHAIKASDELEKSLVLFLAGDGPERESLQQTTHDLGLENNIVFLGMLKESDLVVFYDQLDIYVHATCAETMSTSVMQAMSMGLPIIASDIAGMDVLITDGRTGLLVPPKNINKLATALSSLLVDNSRAELLANNARQHACIELSHTSSWAKYLALFDS